MLSQTITLRQQEKLACHGRRLCASTLAGKKCRVCFESCATGMSDMSTNRVPQLVLIVNNEGAPKFQ